MGIFMGLIEYFFTKIWGEIMNTDSFKDVLNKFMPDDNSISLLADYLGYEVGKNTAE